MRQQRSFATEGIILDHRNLGEADRVLTLLTPYKGKISAIAKGVRRPVSKKTGHLELLCHSQLQIATGRNLDIITQAESIESFQHLRSERWQMACGFCLSEMVYRMIAAENEHTEVYQLLLLALRVLDAEANKEARLQAEGVTELRHDRSQLLMRYVEIHMLTAIGYEPVLRNCAHCDHELQPEENGFTPTLGGALCPNCRHLWTQSLSKNSLKVLRILQRTAWQEIPQFQLDARVHAEIEHTLRSLLRFHLENDLRSWNLLDMLKNEQYQQAKQA